MPADIKVSEDASIFRCPKRATAAPLRGESSTNATPMGIITMPAVKLVSFST